MVLIVCIFILIRLTVRNMLDKLFLGITRMKDGEMEPDMFIVHIFGTLFKNMVGIVLNMR